MDQSTMQFNFKNIEKNMSMLKLPSKKWMTVKNLNNEIKFVRVENDYSTYLTVSLNIQLEMKVYYKSKLLKWIQCDKPQVDEDIVEVLQLIDKVIDCGSMYMPDELL